MKLSEPAKRTPVEIYASVFILIIIGLSVGTTLTGFAVSGEDPGILGDYAIYIILGVVGILLFGVIYFLLRKRNKKKQAGNGKNVAGKSIEKVVGAGKSKKNKKEKKPKKLDKKTDAEIQIEMIEKIKEESAKTIEKLIKSGNSFLRKKDLEGARQNYGKISKIYKDNKLNDKKLYDKIVKFYNKLI